MYYCYGFLRIFYTYIRNYGRKVGKSTELLDIRRMAGGARAAASGISGEINF